MGWVDELEFFLGCCIRFPFSPGFVEEQESRNKRKKSLSTLSLVRAGGAGATDGLDFFVR